MSGKIIRLKTSGFVKITKKVLASYKEILDRV